MAGWENTFLPHSSEDLFDIKNMEVDVGMMIKYEQMVIKCTEYTLCGAPLTTTPYTHTQLGGEIAAG